MEMEMLRQAYQSESLFVVVIAILTAVACDKSESYAMKIERTERWLLAFAIRLKDAREGKQILGGG